MSKWHYFVRPTQTFFVLQHRLREVRNKPPRQQWHAAHKSPPSPRGTSIESVQDISKQGRYRIVRKENLDSIHIYKGIWIREENQNIDKKGQDIFKSLKIKSSQNSWAWSIRNLARKPSTPLRVSQLDTTSARFKCRAEAMSSGLGTSSIPVKGTYSRMNMPNRWENSSKVGTNW